MLLNSNQNGRLPAYHANRLRLISGIGNKYLLDNKWSNTEYCAYWEDGINDWWYEDEYIDWIKNRPKKSTEYTEDEKANYKILHRVFN